MCARRFLIIVFIFTLLAVAGAFAIFQFGERVLLQSATPRGHFQAPPGGGAPAYADAGLWLARPGMNDNPANWRPEELGNEEIGTAAVFYVHPTTYLERDRWNALFQDNEQTEFRTRLFVQSQASAFNGAGEVWAPRYRQAAYGAFLLKSTDAQQALDLAYSDILSAFDEFLRQVPEDKPLILAGHSQGALHVSRLLTERGDDLRRRLVAAYVVGWPISETADLPAMGLPPCTAPVQAGCLLSWQSFGEPANPSLVMDAWEGTRGPAGIERRRKDMLCVNPLSGTRGGAAPPQANPGTLVPTADMASARVEAGRVGARCNNGLLIVGGDIPPLGPFVLPGNNYHVFDYALFWGAIREDAQRRLSAWRR